MALALVGTAGAGAALLVVADVVLRAGFVDAGAGRVGADAERTPAGLHVVRDAAVAGVEEGVGVAVGGPDGDGERAGVGPGGDAEFGGSAVGGDQGRALVAVGDSGEVAAEVGREVAAVGEYAHVFEFGEHVARVLVEQRFDAVGG